MIFPTTISYVGITRVLSLMSAIVGGLALIGWFAHIPILTSFVIGTPTMKINAALIMVLSGLALNEIAGARISSSQRWLISLAVGLTLLIGLATLAQYIFGRDLGIDQFLLHQPINDPFTQHPGRMSMLSSINFILVSVAIILLYSQRGAYYPVQILAIVALILSLMNFIAYLYGLEAITRFTPMSIPAMFGFLLLTMGILTATVNHGYLARLKSQLQSLLFFSVIFLLVILGCASLYNIHRMLQKNEQIALSHEILRNMEIIKNDLSAYSMNVRGYIITGNETFLSSLANTRDHFFEESNIIDKLDKNIAKQTTSELHELARLIKSRIQLADQTVTMAKAQRFDEIKNMLGEEITSLDSKIENLYVKVKELESKNLQSMLMDSSMITGTMVISLIFGGAFSLTLLIFLFLNLRHLNLNLESKIYERTIELQKSNQELRLNEERFRIAAKASHSHIYQWDLDTNTVMKLNDTDRQLNDPRGESDLSFEGYEAWLNSIHPDDRERVVSAIQEHFHHPHISFDEEYRMRVKNGNYHYYRDSGMLVSNGGARRWVGAISDINSQKLQEQQLIQAQKMDAMGQLTGGVAHDFNNRLTAIIGNLELLETRLPDDPSVRRYLQSALKAAESGAELTKKLLSFSRRQVLETRQLNINDLLRGMHDMFVRTLGDAVEIDISLADDLWPVNIDPHQLENVLLNLAINGRDAMPGGGTLIIETSNCTLDEQYLTTHALVVTGDYVLIAVTDTGMGMTEEVKTRAFEPFFTTKEQGKGTGIGLSIAYGFIKQSKGYIEIYSELGYGTSFKLYLPRQTITASEMPHAAPVEAAVPDKLTGCKVLVVEDEPAVLDIARETLVDMDCQVLTAENGPLALKCFARDPDIDILFTDIVMPGGMTGIDVAQRLRALNPDLKVIYTSGYARHAATGITHWSQHGDYWLPKPYRPNGLRKIISQASRGKKHRQ